MKQRIAFCRTVDGVDIAYARTGKGTPVIPTSHFMTHLEHNVESPIWGHVLRYFAMHHSLISYDARYEGMSPRGDGEISFDAWKRDLDAVVEAIGEDRFVLFGASQGAATAIAYAVANPDRVSHLILYGGFANNRIRWHDKRSLDLARSLIREGWGSDNDAYHQWFTSRFIPDGTTEQFRFFNKMQRLSATPDVAERHLVASANIDVTSLLPTLRVPTLVLHCRDDIIAPMACGEELASKIPGADFVPLTGRNHMFLPGSTAHREFAEAVADFLGDPPPPRVLPGTGGLDQRASAAVGAVEGNWLIKAMLLAGAVIGLMLSVAQIAGLLG